MWGRTARSRRHRTMMICTMSQSLLIDQMHLPQVQQTSHHILREGENLLPLRACYWALPLKNQILTGQMIFSPAPKKRLLSCLGSFTV